MSDIVFHALVGSLGHDSATACAAARAGLGRATALPYLVEGENGGQPAWGHLVDGVAGGFQGTARLARLLSTPLRSLLVSLPLDQWSRHRVALYMALPCPDRYRLGLYRIGNPEAREAYEQRLPPRDPHSRPQDQARQILSTLRRGEGIDLPIGVCTAAVGRTAFTNLLIDAAADLDRDDVDVAIVASVDSLCTDAALDWLVATRRLKSDQQPVGLMPGEAAALCVLASPRTAAALELRAQASVLEGPVSTSTKAFSEGVVTDGRGLAEVLGAIDPDCPWVLVDQNGEEFRASEWGCALTRATPQCPQLETAEVWYPAVSFGDVGVAFAGVATCIALRAFARAYAPGPAALIVSSDDGPERAGHLVVNRSSG